MNDKILESYVSDFGERYEIGKLPLAQQFMHFVNYCVVSKNTSDHVDVADLTTDGEGDIGIDGIALLVEDHVVSSDEDIRFFRERLGRLNAEFILIQSKSGSSFSAADLGNFFFGVRAFFGANVPANCNESIREAFDLKERIYKHSIDMEYAPVCSLYYAAAGEWKDDAVLVSRVETEMAALKATSLFSAVRFTPLDAARLRSLYRAIRNKTVCEITFDKHTILPAINGITEAYLGILPGSEYLKLITGDDGQIQRGLFYDNVRDFQGQNPVNQEVAATLSDPATSDRFVLLNNGITVVARSISKVGAKFKISDYQVVNGCQTSHVVFLNRAKLTDKVYLPVKLVVTDNAEVTNDVIRGTNRQTEVKVEAFESLSPFHRVLEDFYGTFKEPARRLYYERRSNQYVATPVDPHAIVSLTMQCKAFLAMFLEAPHSTHRYYGEILNSNRGRMFEENHRPYPYYASAYALKKIGGMLWRGEIPGWFNKFRHHILMLVRASAAGKEMPPLSSKKMDEYSERLCSVLWDHQAFREHVQAACDLIQRAYDNFTGDRYLAPRLRDFTAQLVPGLRSRNKGVVRYYNRDQGFGFIEVTGHEDVFVHHSAVKNKIEADIRLGELLEFDIVMTDRGPQARDVSVVRASA